MSTTSTLENGKLTVVTENNGIKEQYEIGASPFASSNDAPTIERVYTLLNHVEVGKVRVEQVKIEAKKNGDGWDINHTYLGTTHAQRNAPNGRKANPRAVLPRGLPASHALEKFAEYAHALFGEEAGV